MKNKLILYNDEYQLFIEKCSSYLNTNDIIKNKDESYTVSIKEQYLEKCANIIEDFLILEGFDKDYNITPKGIIYEKIIDELYDQLDVS